MAGLTENGFEKKNLATIKQEIEDAFRAAFGIFINLLPGSVFQTIIGIFAERESAIWDLAEEVYLSQYPDTADGNNLDNVVGINGITRLQATKTKIRNQLLFGDIGTLIPAATQFSVLGNPLAKFLTQGPVTLVAGANEQQEIEFDAVPDSGTWKLRFRGQTTPDLAHNASNAVIQAALNALSTLSGVIVTGDYATGILVEFAGDDGLQDQPLIEIVDNVLEDNSMNLVAISVTAVVPGEPQGLVDLEAVDSGVVNAPLYTLTVIDTPVSGLNRVINVTEAALGRERETDAQLRARRRATLQIAGNATPDAIRSRILNIEGVRNCLVFENVTNVVDIDGRPPKSYEVVVDGGSDDEIAEVIWLSKPAGIETFGTITENVVDSQGVTRQVKFSRPTGIPIYFSIDLTVNPVLFPNNGSAQAEAAVIEWGNKIGIGGNVIVYPQLVAQLNEIPGILDVRVRIDKAPVSTTPNDPAVDDNIVIAADEVSEFSNANGQINIL